MSSVTRSMGLDLYSGYWTFNAGNAPTLTKQLVNQLGGTVTGSYVSAGQYKIIFSGVPLNHNSNAVAFVNGLSCRNQGSSSPFGLLNVAGTLYRVSISLSTSGSDGLLTMAFRLDSTNALTDLPAVNMVLQIRVERYYV